METTKNMVLLIKQAKKDLGLTYQEIVDRTERSGEPVSLSTVKRLFSEDGAFDFRYDTTLRPIANALGVTFDTTTELEDEDMNTALAMIRETYEARINDLWKHIVSLKRDKLILGVVIVILFAFILYLFADGLHGNWGIFQYPVT